jgi:hypothetical protein
VVTGTSPSAAATIATITYTTAFPSDSYVVLFPANDNAAALSGTSAVYAAGTASTFVITAGSAALADSTTYIWNFIVVGV